MSNYIANKIKAEDKILAKVLNDERFKIDVFQREYRWKEKNMDDLLNDITSSFKQCYSDSHSAKDISTLYNSYYMGPIVVCEDNGSLSIVDGQQRLTSFTLLLIYLQKLQKELELENPKDLTKYLFVDKGGENTLILDIETREPIIRHLLESDDEFEDEIKDESVQNIIDRFKDIDRLMPEDIKDAKKLPLFIEWLLYKIVLVEVRAFSMENAYTIFETMNDRGLNLTPTEMLKGYILSKINDDEKSLELNELWKDRIALLRAIVGTEGDGEFFRAWLRAKYADTIRKSAVGSSNEDFEKIGTQFHAWVRDNSPKKTRLEKSDDYYFFLQSDFEFFSNLFLEVYKFKNEQIPELEHFYIVDHYTIASSLSYPLFLSSITKLDDETTILDKLLIVNKFIDVYTNVRSISGKTIAQSSIKNAMYELVKSIRNIEIDELKSKLKNELLKSFDFDGNKSPFDTLQELDNGDYYHYFFARILFEMRGEEYQNFSDLMRSKRQRSLVLVQIFQQEDILVEEFDEYVVAMHISSVANYCLIPRNEVASFIELDANRKIKYLLENNYVPEIDDYNLGQGNIDYAMDFIQQRDEKLQKLVNSIWRF